MKKTKREYGFIYSNEGCEALVAEGDGWATIYFVESHIPDKGYCQSLLKELKRMYKYVEFGCTVALNDKMSHILEKLGITEYK